MVKRSTYKEEYDERRYSLEVINGVYIPKNLEECFKELDRMLPEETKSRLKTLERRYKSFGHFSPGLWIRNNWGLWQGSRLKLYFKQKGIDDPDGMSGIITFFYIYWLKGDNEIWKEWESNPKQYIEILASRTFLQT